MRTSEQAPYIKKVDAVLRPLGFNKFARSQEWSRVVATDRQWVHLNFGLAIVNASLGVEYLDIRDAWKDIPGAVFGTLVMLSSATDLGAEHALDRKPASVASDIQAIAVDKLESLRDRESVVGCLKEADAGSWPVPSYSHRIRLAPLIIAQAGRLKEAVNVAEFFLAESAGRDQFVPKYSEYVEALHHRAAA